MPSLQIRPEGDIINKYPNIKVWELSASSLLLSHFLHSKVYPEIVEEELSKFISINLKVRTRDDMGHSKYLKTPFR